MSIASTYQERGVLLVLTKPKAPTYLHEFHQWYDTEHGPLRMKLDFIEHGYRYRTEGKASDAVWAALYDVEQLSKLKEAQYTNLRKFRSKREQEIMSSKVHVLQRKIGQIISSRGKSKGHAPVTVIMSFVVRKDHLGDVHRWYEEEYLGAVARISGWRSSRAFRVIDGDVPKAERVEMLSVHEFEQFNGLQESKYLLSGSGPWTKSVTDLIESRSSQQFIFHHEFRAENYQKPPDTSSVIRAGPREKLVQSRPMISLEEQKGQEVVPFRHVVSPVVS